MDISSSLEKINHLLPSLNNLMCRLHSKGYYVPRINKSKYYSTWTLNLVNRQGSAVKFDGLLSFNEALRILKAYQLEVDLDAR